MPSAHAHYARRQTSASSGMRSSASWMRWCSPSVAGHDIVNPLLTGDSQ